MGVQDAMASGHRRGTNVIAHVASRAAASRKGAPSSIKRIACTTAICPDPFRRFGERLPAAWLPALVFLLASWGAFGEMPTFERLDNPQTNLATEII